MQESTEQSIFLPGDSALSETLFGINLATVEDQQSPEKIRERVSELQHEVLKLLSSLNMPADTKKKYHVTAHQLESKKEIFPFLGNITTQNGKVKIHINDMYLNLLLGTQQDGVADGIFWTTEPTHTGSALVANGSLSITVRQPVTSFHSTDRKVEQDPKLQASVLLAANFDQQCKGSKLGALLSEYVFPMIPGDGGTPRGYALPAWSLHARMMRSFLEPEGGILAPLITPDNKETLEYLTDFANPSKFMEAALERIQEASNEAPVETGAITSAFEITDFNSWSHPHHFGSSKTFSNFCHGSNPVMDIALGKRITDAAKFSQWLDYYLLWMQSHNVLDSYNSKACPVVLYRGDFKETLDSMKPLFAKLPELRKSLACQAFPDMQAVMEILWYTTKELKDGKGIIATNYRARAEGNAQNSRYTANSLLITAHNAALDIVNSALHSLINVSPDALLTQQLAFLDERTMENHRTLVDSMTEALRTNTVNRSHKNAKIWDLVQAFEEFEKTPVGVSDIHFFPRHDVGHRLYYRKPEFVHSRKALLAKTLGLFKTIYGAMYLLSTDNIDNDAARANGIPKFPFSLMKDDVINSVRMDMFQLEQRFYSEVSEVSSPLAWAEHFDKFPKHIWDILPQQPKCMAEFYAYKMNERMPSMYDGMQSNV